MCSRVAGVVLPRPQVGSKSVLILESLSLDQWRWCTTLKCITDRLRNTDELEIFIETCSQVVSGIVSPSSPSHLCLRPSKLVSLWSLNTVYILPITNRFRVCFVCNYQVQQRSGRVHRETLRIRWDKTSNLQISKKLKSMKLKLFETALQKKQTSYLYL